MNKLDLESALPWLIAGVAALGVAGVFAGVRSHRARQQALRETIRSLGFIPAEATPELMRRLKQLHAGSTAGENKFSKQNYEVTNVFTRRIGEGEMFVFDLVDKENDSGYTERQGVAIVSGRLRLPPFMLLPRAGGDGVVSKLADRAIAWASRKMGAQVDFPNHPELARHYLIHSSDADATRHFLSGARLNRLAGMPHLFIRAGGDMFTVSSFVGTTNAANAEQLRERIDRATTVLTIFTS